MSVGFSHNNDTWIDVISHCTSRDYSYQNIYFFSLIDEQEEPPEPMGGEVVCTDPMEITPCESSLLPSSTPSTRDPPTGSTEDTQDDTLVNVNLTTETVIVLGIGVILFIILIILIIVLVACVCRKRKPKQYRFKSPTTGVCTVT